MHKLLKRQIKRKYPVAELPQELQELTQAISDAYSDFDNERTLLERSLELVSDELNQRNAELRNRLLELEDTFHQLGSSMAVLDSIFDATGEAIFAFDNNGRLIRFNRAAQSLLSLPKVGEVYGNSKIKLLLYKLLKEPANFFFELRKLNANPTTNLFGVVALKDQQLFEYHSSPQLSNDQLVGRVWCFRNVTQLKENEATIQFQAFHDALTQLPNRVLMLDRINHAIALSRRTNDLVAILFLDLDHFKKVNDTAGHQLGDELLIEVSRRIKSCLREYDTLARFGGDEFVVLLENIKSHQFASQTCQRIIHQLKKPFDLEGQVFHISTSIGVSIYPRDDDEPEELIRKADLAMYHAKENGRSHFEFFDKPLERMAHFQLELENKLRAAIKKHELSVYYQPQVDIREFKVRRVEALLRWFPEDGKPVPPSDFIPVAERAHLIGKIGYWVLEQACLQVKEWQSVGIENIRVAVNLSAQQFVGKKLVEDVKELIKKYGIEGRLLEFEITESILLEDLENVKEVLLELRKMDITVAIDDFGTGYSSLKYLQKLPIDSLKIDRSFIRELAENPNNKSIVNTIISLGHNLNLSVVAEGVEDKKMVAFLCERQCDFIQGYYFYKPMPVEEVTKILAQES
ncbi:putative bifunctional diguanylate cyclase/phosphodiesterase [Aliikangiella coralliicola]|uniref:cyclic-guanylate-specific phosphodiesterase n=1 Tax=Aliikangiella coralliicola TaxID=2592383 RepID=A0A545UH23_9GAMM|nr:EAL domain-containing protein [Aliikangiella coralliicola]TQV88767.1 EAL domain-containing protein [Aliikangiella coralliicola]